MNTPIQRFVANWLKTHDYPLDYELDSSGGGMIRMNAKSELIDDLYATGDSQVFRSALERAVSSRLDHNADGLDCPTDDLEEMLCLWVSARLPAPKEHLVEELFHSIFTLRTANEALSRSALSTGLLYAILDYDDEHVSIQAAFADLKAEGLIYETGEYRRGRPVMMLTPKGVTEPERLRDTSGDEFDDEEQIARVRDFAAAAGEVCAGLSLAESEFVFYVWSALQMLEDERRNDGSVMLTTPAIAERATELMREGVLRTDPGEPELEVSDEGIEFVMERLWAAGWVESRLVGDGDDSWC